MINRRKFLKAGVPLAASPIWLPHCGWAQSLASSTALPAAGADGWISLLNGRDLTGWYTMLQKSGKNVAEARKVVVMEQEMLHILGNDMNAEPAEAGYLATNQEFENVHIRVEYKWGVKRFPPRSETKRDNGILYGLVGAEKVWPTCVECQIEEGDVGDYFLVEGTRGIQASHGNGLFGQGLGPNGWAGAATPRPPKPGATPPEPTGGRMIKDGDFEILDGSYGKAIAPPTLSMGELSTLPPCCSSPTRKTRESIFLSPEGKLRSKLSSRKYGSGESKFVP
jgi:hypothetical protein